MLLAYSFELLVSEVRMCLSLVSRSDMQFGFCEFVFLRARSGPQVKNVRPKNWGRRSKFVQPWKLGINNDYLKCDVLPYENNSNFY